MSSKWGDAAEAGNGTQQAQQAVKKLDNATAPAILPAPGLPALGPGQELIAEQEEAPGKILRTIREFRINDEGRRIQVVKKIRLTKKTVKTNADIEKRKKWAKFGDCQGLPPGPEPGVTALDNETSWQFKYIAAEAQAKKDAAARAAKEKADAALGSEAVDEKKALGISCRVCGRTGDHWTHQCPYKDKLEFLGLKEPSVGEDVAALASAAGAVPGGGDGKYVPPGLRGAGGAAAGGAELTKMFTRESRYDDDATLRVSNLADETTEEDLEEAFRNLWPPARVSRTYVGRDRETGRAKGFAYVTFVSTSDAQRALDQMSDKFGMHHVIIHLEWAQKKQDGAGGGGGGPPGGGGGAGRFDRHMGVEDRGARPGSRGGRW